MTFDSLAEYRKRAGLTQKEVGDHIGISSQAVSKWENGQAEPDIDTLYRLAELYNTTVDALVGKNSENVDNKEEKNRFAAIKDFISKYKMIIIISAAAVLAIVATIIIIVSLKDAHEEENLYKRYERLELGMSMEEVEDILGKAEEVESKYFEDESGLGAGIALSIYGYINADFWYYRGDEYEENIKAMESLDAEYEFLPYYQLRVVFDADGKLIEAYFNTNMEFSIFRDEYGAGDDKVLTSVEYLDGSHSEDETKENAKLFFEDGSAFLGEVEFAKNSMDEEYIKHHWGDLYINQQ